MKNVTKLWMLFILVTCFTSCSLFDVDVETTLSGDLEIQTENTPLKSAAVYKFDSYFTINPLDNGDVEDNADKIDRITADGIIATVEYVSTKTITLYPNTTITIDNGKKSATWKFSTEMLIQEGTEILLEDVADIYDEVSDILTSMNIFTVSSEGTASEPGAFITIRIDIETTVTGNPF